MQKRMPYLIKKNMVMFRVGVCVLVETLPTASSNEMCRKYSLSYFCPKTCLFLQFEKSRPKKKFDLRILCRTKVGKVVIWCGTDERERKRRGRENIRDSELKRESEGKEGAEKRWRKLVFYAEPSTKTISRQNNHPCKQMPHAKKEQRARHENWIQDIKSSLRWWQALTVASPDLSEREREKKKNTQGRSYGRKRKPCSRCWIWIWAVKLGTGSQEYKCQTNESGDHWKVNITQMF